MTLDQQIILLQIKKTRLIKDIASIEWKERNPEKVKSYQDNYRKTNCIVLAEKARTKRAIHGEQINARRRELYARK